MVWLIFFKDKILTGPVSANQKMPLAATRTGPVSRWAFTLIAGSVVIGLQCGPARASEYFPLDDSPAANPNKEIIEAWQDAPGKEAQGYMLYDMDRAETILSHNAQKGFIPASTTKVFTGLAALKVLGHDHQFTTTLAYTGDMDNGIIDGDLYLIGGGDPLFTITGLLHLVERLRIHGVRQVQGKFYYDDSHGPFIEIIEPAMSDEDAYNPPVSSLSFNYNAFQAQWVEDHFSLEKRRFEEGHKDFKLWPRGNPRKLNLVPNLPLYRVATGPPNELDPEDITFKWGPALSELPGEPARELWQVPDNFFDKAPRYVINRGKRGFPVKNPALYCALTFHQLAHRFGMDIPLPGRATDLPSSFEEEFEHKSPSVNSIVRSNLYWSTNLQSELLLLAVARELKDDPVYSLREAGQYVERWFRAQLPEARWTGFHLANGSGLTGKNRISPEQAISVLLWAYNKKFGEKTFVSMLPASGWTGSMAGQFFADDNAMRIFAKTGVVWYGVGFIGYMFTKDGRRLAFAQYFSDYEQRGILDDLDNPQRIYSKKAAGRWVSGKKEIYKLRTLHWLEGNFDYGYQ